MIRRATQSRFFYLKLLLITTMKTMQILGAALLGFGLSTTAFAQTTPGVATPGTTITPGTSGTMSTPIGNSATTPGTLNSNPGAVVTPGAVPGTMSGTTSGSLNTNPTGTTSGTITPGTLSPATTPGTQPMTPGARQSQSRRSNTRTTNTNTTTTRP
jgi:hypothetical protein